MRSLTKPKKKEAKLDLALTEEKAARQAREDALLVQIADSFGMPGMDQLVCHLLEQLQTVQGAGNEGKDLMLTIQTVLSLKPKNALEAMLIVQLVGVHTAAVSCFWKADATAKSGGSIEAVDLYFTRATRLMRLFNEQLEALSKLRGENVHQRVVVQNVDIHPGSQAIVGAVTTQGGRGY